MVVLDYNILLTQSNDSWTERVKLIYPNWPPTKQFQHNRKVILFGLGEDAIVDLLIDANIFICAIACAKSTEYAIEVSKHITDYVVRIIRSIRSSPSIANVFNYKLFMYVPDCKQSYPGFNLRSTGITKTFEGTLFGVASNEYFRMLTFSNSYQLVDLVSLSEISNPNHNNKFPNCGRFVVNSQGPISINVSGNSN
jgi:hypothetical protein